jgi:prolyl oligopeptidase
MTRTERTLQPSREGTGMKHALPLAALALFGLAVLTVAAEPLTYPDTRRGEQMDVYHGTRVADPYRWLEDDVRKSPEVSAWVAAENKVTFRYLESIPQREPIKKRLTELWNYERHSVPFQAGGRYFYFKNDGLQNQAVLYTLARLDGEPHVLLDPNSWSKDGTVALAGQAVSDNGRYLAYGVAEAGSDWQTWKVLDVATGQPLADEVKWVKYSETTWTRDGRGFFYSRYAEPKAGDKFQSQTLNQMLCYHRAGSTQADDVLVYQRPDHPKWNFAALVGDGRYLVIEIREGTDARHRITYRDLAEPLAMPVDLIDDFDNQYAFVDNDGPIFYFKTDYRAPRGRLIAIDIRKPERSDWKEIIPEAKDNLRGVDMVDNLFIANYLHDAQSQVKIFAPDGTVVRDVPFPGIVTATGFGGRRTDTETFYSISSFATPPKVFHYDLITGRSKLFREPQVKFNPDEYEVKQVFATSKDGTRVPLFITARKGLELDGSNPTLLYGYGGFDIPLTPTFNMTWASWLDLGGVFVQANLRGGGEYGKDWHKAGTKLHKQNVFDDFIAAAEWLIANKYTRTDRLAVIGRSNGGLLVGAVETQRPDLFGACLPGVGVMDMLRFQKFTAGRFWTDDYGSSDNADEFKALYAYSPYHNLKKGTKYPATLVTTADHDDRVVPGHSFKFAAQLQYCQAGPAPVLIRIETRAGHGAGKPTAKVIEEVADQWAFLVKNLDMKLPRW